MLTKLAQGASRFMQALIPAGPQMGTSSAAWPSTAPWADYWYNSMGLSNIEGLIGGDEAYEHVSTCFAATRVLCGIGSKMPLNRVRKTSTDDGETAVVMRNNPVHRLMNFQANPDQTAMVFRSMMVAWQVNRGTAFAEIERETRTNAPIALWPIHPSRCRPFRSDKDGSLWWHVRNNDGTDCDIADVNMLRVPYTILDRSGLCGVGVADRATKTIMLGQSLDRTENDASMSGVPRIVVESERVMTQLEQDAFRRQWRELYTQGGEGVALLVGKTTAKPLSWSAVDSDHVRRREFNIEDIARWYDVPLTLLRRALKETAGNVEQLGQEFQTYSLAFLEIWEQELGRKLLTEDDLNGGECWELDYKALLRADHAARATYHSAMVPIGVENPNEARATEGMNPYPSGKKYFVQGALRPIDEPYAQNKPQDSPIDPKVGKANPMKPPKPKQAALKNGARLMLEDCIRRLTHKEATAACRAAKKPGEWMNWIDTFYADHEPWAASELKMPLEVCSVFGVKLDPGKYASGLAEQSKTALIEASDGDPTGFIMRVEAVTAKWESDRASAAVRSIAELN